MTVLIALVPLGIMFGLIMRAAMKAPDNYIDLMVMTEERHTKQNMEDIDQ